MEIQDIFFSVLIALTTIFAFGSTGGIALALCYSPRITSEHVPDCSSLKAYRNFHAWRDKQGQELALAAWKCFVGTETGVFHYQPIREGPDQVDWEFRIIRDPIKMLNVYGYGFCGAFGPTTAGFFEGLGFEKARSVNIPGVNHSVTEVFYDGAWHYFDTDLRGVLFRRDGTTIASIEDVLREPALWTNPSRKIEPFFPEDQDLSVYAEGYRRTPVDYCYHWFMGGSTMDYVLRQGESLTRYWHPQGGRWSHQEEDAEKPFFRRLIHQEPFGAKGNHPRFSIWTHGNGLFDYAPRLRKDSSDFDNGVFDRKNVELTDEGLTLARDGEGEAVFEILSPYVIVPLVGDIDDRSDDREASVVTFTSRGQVRVSISLDHSRSFTLVKTVNDDGETSLDLSPYLRERYQYLIKFTLVGKRGGAYLDSLRIRTWVQVAPISLPRLKKGVNHLSYDVGDQHGLFTTPWLHIPNMGDQEEMSRYWEREPKDYNPQRKTQRLKGEMDLLFNAPPGRKIKWMSLGGFFNTYQRAAATNTRNEMWYALGDSDNWNLAHRANVPTWHSHWHYAYDEEIVLDEPVDKVRVRYVGNPGVNGIRVNIHSLRQGEKPDNSVVVTHCFKMNGRTEERRFTFDKPTDYVIDCPAAPEDVFIKLEVPSDKNTP